jgi:hypothetical protein
MMAILFIVLMAAIVLGVIVYSYYAEKQRREAMVQIAQKLGLTYLEQTSNYKDSQYSNLKLFREGHSRKSYNVIGGRIERYEVELFDYRYVTGSGKNSQTHYYSVCILTVPQRFKSLYIRHENFLDKIAGAIGFDDIDFASKEFSKKYYVKSDDRKFAYDIIHPQMIEFLLQSLMVPVIEMEGKHLAFYVNKKIQPESYVGLYDFADKFYNKTPGYVLEECA